MKRIESNNKNILKRNLAASLVLLFVIAISIAGATHAWFTSGADLENVFTAGTVILEQPGEPVYSSETTVVDDVNVECKTVTWRLINTGSKNAYIRVKPLAELIQVESIPIYIALKVNISGNDIDSLLLYDGNDVSSNQYIEYYVGSGTELIPVVGYLISKGASSQLFEDSHIHIWDTEVNGERRLFVKIVSIGSPPPGYQPYNLFFYAGLESFDEFNYNGNYWNSYPIKYLTEDSYNEVLILDQDGNYTVKEPYLDQNTDQYDFNLQGENDGLPFVFETIVNDNNVIVSLSELYDNQEITTSSLQPELCNNSKTLWHRGIGVDDWWYYGIEPDGPINLSPEGGEVSVCFRYCDTFNPGSTFKVSLVAEAIQWSNSAIDHEWVVWNDNQVIGNHPWYLGPFVR